MVVEVKDTTPEKLIRKKFPGQLAKSPYVADFDSGSSSTFQMNHPFVSDIDAFDVMSPLSCAFWKFVEEGLNGSKRAKTLYKGDENELSKCFLFGSCVVETKDWFWTLAICNQPLGDMHLDVIFYYLRKKAKYEPGLVKFTTTDFVFDNKLVALYKDFETNQKDFSVIPENHQLEEYVRGFICDANVAWHKVDHVLFPIYVLRGGAGMGHWILGIFTFNDWCIYVYDSNRVNRHREKSIKKMVLHYKTLIPYFLERVNFYVEKGINKSDCGDLEIELVDDLPQQVNCDCGAFVAAFAEYFVHGKKIPKELDIGVVRMRYGALLWDYGRKKQEAGATIETTEKVGKFFGKRKRGCEEK